MGRLSKCILLLIVGLLLVTGAYSDDEQKPPLYTSYGLTTGGFATYDKQFLGAGGYLAMPAITPYYISQAVLNFGKSLVQESKLQRIEKWVEFLTGEELNLSDNYNTIMSQVSQANGLVKRFSTDPWGFCVANGDNLPSGADNFFLVSFPNENSVVWVDLAHTDDLWANKDLVSSMINVDDNVKNVVGKIAEIIGIQIPSIKIPGGGIFDLPNCPTPGGVDHFRNPRGICTNGKGEFWIADYGNNQIVRARFNKENNFMELLGMLKGLNSPSDVCIFPGTGEGSNDVLGIANTGGHSIVFTNAKFFGEASIQNVEKYELKNVFLSSGQSSIISPLSISSSQISSDECYFTCSDNKIIKLRRLDQYLFTPEAAVDWPMQGVLTCVKTDLSGDPFVVDNTNNYIGKYTSDLDLLFTTGGTNPNSNTLVDDFKFGSIYFENPKYVSFGNEKKAVFVTERMRGYCGIKRFLNWPRFLDGSISFGLKCDQVGLVDPSKMEMRFALTKQAMIDINIMRVNGDDQRTFFDSRNYSEFSSSFSSGEHTLDFDFTDSEGAGNSSIVYICTFKAFDPDYPDEEADSKTYIVSLGAPNFFGDATLTNNFFNPDNKVFPQLNFEITRSSRVTFKLVPVGESFENGITIEQDRFDRNLTIPHSINLYRIMQSGQLVPMTSSNAATVLGDIDYELWASLEALPCGAANTLKVPLSIAKTIAFDGTDPEIQFATPKNKAYNDLTVNGINPQNSRFNSVTFKLTPSDNSDAQTWSKVSIRKNEAVETVVKDFGEVEAIGDGSKQLNYTFTYDGMGDDELCVTSAIRDMAGNSAEYNPVTSESARLIKIDSRAPDVTVAFRATPENETVGSGLAAVLNNQQKINIDFTVKDAFPKSIYIELFRYDRYEWLPSASFFRKLDCPISPLWTGSDKEWSGSFELNAPDFATDGVYTFRIVAEDYLGNSTVASPVTSIAGHNYIWVNKYAPVLTASVFPKVIRKGEKNTLVIDSRVDSEDPEASFVYSCDIYLSWLNSSGVFEDLSAYTQRNVQITSSQPSLRIQFDHALLAAQNTGHFRYRVVVRDNVGATGLQTEQTADFFVETFPPVISGDFTQPMPEKFHVMGQVGDPDLTNDPTENGFDYYTVYYTSGTETVLPASISTLGSNWKQNGIFVPFHTVDRGKNRAFDYPLSNVADNYQSVTSAWGLAPLFSVDAENGGIAAGTYTFLVYVHEAGKSDVVNAKNSTLKTITIGNETSPDFENVLVEKVNGPATHNLNTGNPVIEVNGNLTDPGYTIDGIVSAFIYRTLDANGAAVKDPFCRRIDLNNISSGEFSFEWNGKDDRGAFVPNGVYKIALSLREKIKSGYSHAILNGHTIVVETPLALTEGELAPQTITQLPVLDAVTELTVLTNVTTFRCMASKPCKVFIEVETPQGEFFTIGGTTTQGGPASEVTIDWDGLHPISGLPVATCNTGEVYKFRPFAIGTEPGAARVNYQFPSGGNNYFPLTIVKNQENTNLTGIITPAQTTGSSDAVWSSPVNGHLWSFPALTTGVAGVNVAGKQAIERNVDGTFSGTYLRFHRILEFKLRYRLKFNRYYTFNVPWSDEHRCNDGYKIIEETDYINFTNSDHMYFDPLLNKNVYKFTHNLFYWFNEMQHANDCDLTGIDPSSTFRDAVGYCGANGPCGEEWGATGHLRNPEILWIQLIGKDNDGNDVFIKELYDSGHDPYYVKQPTPPLPSGFFYDGKLGAADESGFVFKGEWLIDPDIFKVQGNLPTHVLTAGEEKNNIITADVSHGIDLAPFNNHLLNMVWHDIDYGSLIQLQINVPSGGTVTIFPGMSGYEKVVYANTAQNLSFSFHIDEIPPAYQNQLLFDYNIRLDAGQTTDAEVVFPLPDRTLCEGNGAACVNCDVWDAANSYVYDRGIVADANSCNLSLNYPSMNLQNDYSNGNLTSTLLSDPRFNYVIKNDNSKPLSFSFPGGATNKRTTYTVNGNSHYLDWRISGSSLTIEYPKEEANAAKSIWNTSTSTVNRDPVLETNNYSLRGYIQTGENSEVFNTDNLSINKSFNSAPFTLTGNTINLFDVYKDLGTGRSSVTIPTYSQTIAADAWKNNSWTWPYLCWYDASGNLRFHDGRDGNSAFGLSATNGGSTTPWGSISLTYIDPKKINDCFILKNDTRNSGLFSFNIAPLAVSHRIVPVEVELTSSPVNLKVTELLVFDPKAKNGSWENIELVQTEVPVSSEMKTLLAYWDVTGKAGVYHLKLVADDGTNSYQLLSSIKIGTLVPDDKTGTPLTPGFTAYSPLKNVELWFPPESPFKGMVGIDPVKLELLKNAGFDGAPKGFLVDITPSGLVFDGPEDTKPSLSFYLTKEEVEMIGGRVDELGLISVYYYNDKKHQLESANFSPALYGLNANGSVNKASRQDVGDGDGIVMNENQVLELKGKLAHTSVYGVVSKGAFIWINPPVTPTAQTAITLTGTFFSSNMGADAHVYKSSSPVWSASAAEITSDLVINGDDTWSLPVILNDGDNYIFASIGSATLDNYPTSSVLVTKDATPPVLSNLTVSPTYITSGTETVLIGVELNEPGEVFLTIPSLSEETFSRKTEKSPYNVKFAIPITNEKIADGEYPFYLTANDRAGNVTNNNLSSVLEIDRNAPYFSDLHVTARLDNVENVYKVDVGGLARDFMGLNNISVFIRDGKTGWTYRRDCMRVVEQAIDGEISLDDNDASPGSVLFAVIEATDMAGNKASCERPFVLQEQEQLTEWPHKKDLIVTIPGNLQLSGVLQDIPIVIRLDHSNFNFTEAAVDGHDVRFTQNGVILPYEIELWDVNVGKAVFWVKATRIASGMQNQNITMYWGNESAATPLNSKLVWDKNFKAVYHMDTFDGNGETPLSQFVIYSTEKTDIRDWVQVTGTKIGSGDYVEIGAYAAVVADIYSSGNAYFRSHSSVKGNVYLGSTLSTQSGYSLDGDLFQHHSVQQEQIPEKQVTPGTTSKVIERGTALDLTADNYGDITVRGGGTLRLHGGNYQFNKLQFDADAAFEIDLVQGQVISINTQTMLAFGDGVKCIFTGVASAPRVSYYTNQTTQLTFGTGTKLYGTVVAPHAPMVIYSRSEFTGSIMAKTVTVEPNSIINGFTAEQTLTSVKQFIRDATLYEMHAEDHGVTETRGLIGIAQKFDGISSYLHCPNLLNSPRDEQMSISGWLQRDNIGVLENLVGMNSVGQSVRFYVDSNNNFILRNQTEQVQNKQDIASIQDWVYFNCCYGNGKMKLYLNGCIVAEKQTDSPIPAEEVPVYIGKWLNTDFFKGTFDELWISNIARNDFWTRITYENQKENSRMVIVPPVAPRGIQTEINYPSTVKITWDVSNYTDLLQIERTESSSNSWVLVANVPVNRSEYFDNVQCGKTYMYRFRYSTAGVVSDYSALDTVQMLICPEETPSNVTALPVDGNSIQLSWNDNSSGESGYQIQMKTFSNTEFIAVTTALPDATVSTIGNLACNTDFDFRIRVVKGEYSSEWAYSNSVSTSSCANSPEAPNMLSVNFNNDRYHLTWTDNSDDEEFFAVYRASTVTSSVNAGDFKLINILPTGITKYEDVSYPCGKYLTYKIAAFNTDVGGGLSDASNLVQVLTLPCTENKGNNLVTINCMLTDGSSNPVTEQNAKIEVKLFTDPLANTVLYNESFICNIKNGYLCVYLGTCGDIGTVVKNNSNIFYELTYNNVRIPVRYPLTSNMNSISNSMVLNGIESPIGLIDAVTGSLYLNTTSQKLYFKFGPSINDWKRIE